MGMLEKVQALLTLTGQAGGGGGGGGGGDITVDSALSNTSTNPVQNKVIKTALDAKQDTLIAGTNITIAADGKTISATGGGGGGDITVDSTLSNTSTNPIQNQYLGKRMGATSSNSVQIGYDAMAGTTVYQAIDGSGGDNGNQVAVGRGANGSSSGVAVGYTANGHTNGVAVGYTANGYTNGAAVGYTAKGYSYGAAVGRGAEGHDYGAAVGYGAKGYGGAAVGSNAKGQTSGAAVGTGAEGNSSGVAVGCTAKGSSRGIAVGYTAEGSSKGIAVGYYAKGSGEDKIAIGYQANATADGSAVLGARSTNTETSSTKVSAYNKTEGALLSIRAVAGATTDASYFDFYYEDKLAETVTGRRISVTNFFALLDEHGATSAIENP